MSYEVRDYISKRVLSHHDSLGRAKNDAGHRAGRDADSRFEVVDDSGRVLYVTTPRRVTR